MSAGGSDETPRPADDVSDALADFRSISAEVHPELFLVRSTPTVVREVLATRPTEPLVGALREIVLRYVNSWGERTPIEYGPATTPADEQIMWVPTSIVPLLAGADADVDAADLKLFDAKKRGIGQLRFSMLWAETDSGRALLYRQLAPRQIVARTGKIPVLQRGDRLDLIEGDTLLIDRSVDAVVVGGYAFFEDRPRFQKLFGFLQDLQARAEETFDDVTSSLQISNLAEMRTAATTQLAMLGKMASIQRKLESFPAYRDAMTMEKLAVFVANNPQTGVQIEGQGSAAKFVFQSDLEHRFKILKLLDDDYLQSQLTTLNYDANSKGMPL